MHLPRTLELGEFREDELNGLLDALVRIPFDPAAPDFHIARGHAENQVAATRHLAQRLLRALAEQRQFEFAHRAFHTQQQSIVGMARIVDSVLVDEDRADQSTELYQRVPVAAVAGEARSLDGKHHTAGRSQIAANNRSKPGRTTPPPDRPRSSSMISTVVQPSCLARSASPYCRRWLSRLCTS